MIAISENADDLYHNKPLSAWGKVCTTRTSQLLSSIESWNVDALSPSTDPQVDTSSILRRGFAGQAERSEFPESTAQNFRNPHLETHSTR